jgi:hypothetical protein
MLKLTNSPCHMEFVVVKWYVLISLLIIFSFISMAGGAWVVRPFGVDESRLIADDRLGEIQLSSYNLLSDLQ